ncbi:hypothetical protein [Telluribacter sp. SYSU D00476]|uniref:hypothetical protein n=1 Tax=Telluribacter sp. SYSU D00476 TaxID=2811430 RepID=UPI001FF392F8|nr:hypothetical protein [Telluribacter sp. SYSU D00476]
MSNIHIQCSNGIPLNSLEYSLQEFGKKLANEENSISKIERCLREQLEDWKQERTKYSNATTTILQVPDVEMLVVLDRPNGHILFTFSARKWWWLWDNRMVKGYLLMHKYRNKNQIPV